MSCFVEIYSLPKNRRLHKTEEFSAVMRFQCKASGNFLQMYAKPNELTYSRIGMIVAKKIERRAVKRNRVKRLLRETFRMHQDHNTKKMDWVIRLRRPINNDDSPHLIMEAKLLMLQLQRCHD